MKQEQSANRTCTFFGHRDCPASLSSELENAIAELIETENVSKFYVGNDGSYDMMVRHALAKIKQRYPHIRYCVVLAYLPAQNAPFGKSGFSDTLYPEGIELVPKRYATNGCWTDRDMWSPMSTILGAARLSLPRWPSAKRKSSATLAIYSIHSCSSSGNPSGSAKKVIFSPV